MMTRNRLAAGLFVLLLITALAANAGPDMRPALQPMPSITPLFFNGRPPNVVPYGASGSSVSAGQAGQTGTGAQAQSITGQAQAAATPASAQPTRQPGALPTLAPSISISDTGQQAAGNALSSIFNSLVVPVINFILTLANGTIVTVWNFAGSQGGLLGQSVCCIVPFLGSVWWLFFRRGLFGRRR